MEVMMLEFTPALIRTTVLLTVAALVALIGSAGLSIRSRKTVAMAWWMVLLAGAIWMPLQLEVPTRTVGRAPQLAVDPEPRARLEPDAVSGGGSPRVEVASALPRGRSVTPQSPPSLPDQQLAAPILRSPEVGTRPSGRWDRCGHYLPLVWAAGFGTIAMLSAVSYLGLLLALRNSWKPQRAWLHEYHTAAARMRIRMPPKLLVHEQLGPMLCMTPCGYRLVIPSDRWATLTPEQRTAVLRHELAHFVRGDAWRSLPSRLVVLVHWFNPLAWYAARRVEDCQEWAADQHAIRDQPEMAGDLAAALLALAHDTGGSRLLVSAARGNSLAGRLQNLIPQPELKGNATMRQTTLIAMMFAVLAVSLVQLRLVAQENESAAPVSDATSEPESPASASSITKGAAEEFAGRLIGEDELTEQLRKALQSEQGALVLRDRAGAYEQNARARARVESIPRFFQELFESRDDRLVLREEHAAFRDQFLEDAEKLEADLKELRQVMSDKAEQLELDTDLARTIHRFLTDRDAGTILYTRQIRRTIQSGGQMFDRAFQELLAKREDGKYVIRPEQREPTAKRFKAYTERRKEGDRLKLDLADFAAGISPLDEDHRRFKELLVDPLVATRMALPIYDSPEFDRRIDDRIIYQFENAVTEGPEGMILREESKAALVRMLDGLERVRDAAVEIREPLRAFVSQITDEDEFHRRLKEVMLTDISLVRTAGRVQYASASIKTVLDMYFGGFLVEADNGKLQVRTNNVSEDSIIALVASVFREARFARRRGREATELIEQVQDEALRSAMMSSGGRIAIGDAVVARTDFGAGGLGIWTQENFESVGDGYSIRDDRRAVIEEFVKQIGLVEAELKNADF